MHSHLIDAWLMCLRQSFKIWNDVSDVSNMKKKSQHDISSSLNSIRTQMNMMIVKKSWRCRKDRDWLLVLLFGYIIHYMNQKEIQKLMYSLSRRVFHRWANVHLHKIHCCFSIFQNVNTLSIRIEHEVTFPHS